MASLEQNLNHLLANVALRIRQSLKLTEILNVTVEEVRQSLKTDRVIIYRFNPDWSGVVTIESVSNQKWSIRGDIIKDPCFEQSWLQTSLEQGTRILEDTHTDKIQPCYWEFLQQYQVRASLVAPIWIAQKSPESDQPHNYYQDNPSYLWGLIIAHECDQPRKWHSSEQDFLAQLATQVGIAIQQSELLKQTRNELKERQKVEASLRESEARFRRLADNAKDVIYRYRWVPQPELEYINPAIMDLTGYGAGEFYAQPSLLFELIHPEDRSQFQQQLEKSTQNSSSLILRFLHRNGTIVWAEQRCNQILSSDHIPIAVEGIVRDLSDRSLNLNRRQMQAAQASLGVLNSSSKANVPFASWLLPFINRIRICQGHSLNSRLPFWTGGLIAIGLVLLTEVMSYLGGKPPFPFLILMGTIVLSANFGGLKSGLVSAVVVSAYIIHATLVGFSFASVTAGSPHVILAILEIFVVAILIGRTKKHNQILTQALQNTNNSLEKRVTERTQALSQANLLLKEEITERQQAEAALRQSEERLQLALEGSGDGLWDWNILTDEMYFSPRWLGMLGYQNHELPEHVSTWKKLIHPEDQNWVYQVLEAHLQDSSLPYAFDYRVRTKSGEWKWIANYGKVVTRDAKGQPLRMVGTHKDISARKQAEAALRQSEERFALAMEGSRDGLWDWNTITNEVYFSPRFKEILGYTEQELPNQVQEWTSRLHPEDRDRVMDVLQNHLEEKIPFDLEYRLRQKQGTYCWICGRGQAIWSQDGKATRMAGSISDISDRKLAEAAVRESEARYRLLADNSTDLISTHTSSGIFLYASPACRYLLGYEPEQLQGRSIYEYYHPEDAAAINPTQTLANAYPYFYTYSYRIRCRDGNYIWFETTAQVITAEDQTHSITVCVSRDITERKTAEAKIAQLNRELEQRVIKRTSQLSATNERLQSELHERRLAEQALQESETRFHVLANSLPMLLWISGSDGKWIFFNRAWLDFTGRTMAQELACGWHQRVHPDDVDGCILAYKSAFEARQTFQLEYRLQRADGEYRWLLDYGMPRFSSAGSFLGYIGACIDISDRKQAEAIVRESERRWRSLLENVRLLVVGLDEQGHIDYVNPYFLNLVGKTKAELFGKDWFQEFVVPSQQQQVKTYFQEVLQQESHLYNQNAILTKSGEEKIIAWNHTLMQDLQGKPIGTISIGEDITERYVIQRMKDEFVSVVSHELRTPLTAIHGGLNLLMTGLVTPDSPQGQRIIQIADESAERLVRLVNDILELERLESGKIRLELQLVNSLNLILRAVDQVQIMANRAGIVIEIEEQEIEFIADSDRLIQILTNLLSNAIKFSPRGSTIWISAKLQLSNQESTTSLHLPPAQQILFTVQDQGRGIPPSKLETIFERFHQVDASDSRRKGGTGLGLAICRNIVEQHGGKIWVKSTLEQGSSFYFTIPAPMRSEKGYDNQKSLSN